MSKPYFVAVAAFALLTDACTTVSGAPVGANTPAPRSSALTPNPRAKSNLLKDVIALSAREAWAVGTYRNNRTRVLDTLILHWDGTTWSKVKSPNPSATANELSAVNGVSSTNVWAVGYYGSDASGPQGTLILHWDGTSWSQVTSPSPSSTYNVLSAVRAVSSTDAWAVGEYASDTSDAEEALILHWDGRSWSQVTSPSPSATINILSAVSAVSSTDAWAVGRYLKARYRTLILRWDGLNWSQVTSPNPSTRRIALGSVTADSFTDAWALGYYRNIKTRAFHTLILHWDGTVWSKVKSPTYDFFCCDSLCCVSVIGPGNGWAVGTYVKEKGTIRTLILHWDGTVWSKVKSPNPSPRNNELRGVSARSANDAWAVGYFRNRTGALDTLVLHWNGTSWSRA